MTLFFTKRMSAAAAFCAVLTWGEPLCLAGFAAGAAVALLKIRLWSGVKLPLAPAGQRPLLSLGGLTPLLSLAVLTAAVVVNTRVFAGCAAGLLSLPLIIVVNTLTEKAGLTHNGWR